jgi:hypothetical protein
MAKTIKKEPYMQVKLNAGTLTQNSAEYNIITSNNIQRLLYYLYVLNCNIFTY